VKEREYILVKNLGVIRATASVLEDITPDDTIIDKRAVYKLIGQLSRWREQIEQEINVEPEEEGEG
jgi:hypothetical protein